MMKHGISIHTNWVTFKSQSKSKYETNSGGYVVGGCFIKSQRSRGLYIAKTHQMDMFFCKLPYIHPFDPQHLVVFRIIQTDSSSSISNLCP